MGYMAKQSEWSRITLRLPSGLHQRIVESTGANSLNSEIVSALEKAFPVLGDTAIEVNRLVATAEFVHLMEAGKPRDLLDIEIKKALEKAEADMHELRKKFSRTAVLQPPTEADD
jgi:hypothetical protein